MEWIFYYEWDEETRPSWGEWRFGWSYQEFPLKIYVKELPDVVLDRNNPRIEWIVGKDARAQARPGECWFRLPTLNHIPVRGPRFEQLSSRIVAARLLLPVLENQQWLYFLEQQFVTHTDLRIHPDEFALENPTMSWENEWASYHRNGGATDIDAHRRFFFLSCLMGEWRLCETLLEGCRWPSAIEGFHRANIQLHLRNRLPREEREVLFATDLWDHVVYEEAWEHLVRLHVRYPSWDRSRLFAYFWEHHHERPNDILASLPPYTWLPSLYLSEDRRIEAYNMLFKDNLSGRLNPFFFQKILTMNDKHQRHNVMNTMIGRITPLIDEPAIEKGDLQFSQDQPDFVASSAGLLVFSTKLYLVNVRRVNYRIMPAGNYISIVNGTITSEYNGITKNEYYFMDRETLRPIVACRALLEDIPHRRKEERAIVGIEDVRLIRGTRDEEDNDEETIYFYGVTREFSYSDAIRIIFGRYDIDRAMLCDTIVARPPYEENACEKNWVHCGDHRFIYRWHPIEIGRIRGKHNRLVIEERFDSPAFFQEFRGSSPGLVWGGFVWCTVHSVVMIQGRRKYLHYLVVLDLERKKKVVAATAPFSFENAPIEYSIGLDIHRGKILFTYSVNDCTSRYLRLPLSYFVERLHFIDDNDRLDFHSRLFHP